MYRFVRSNRSSNIVSDRYSPRPNSFNEEEYYNGERFEIGGVDFERNEHPDYSGAGPKNYSPSFERIKEEACEELKRNPLVDASCITVEVKDGIIHLSGHVPDRTQKKEAEECIEHLSGVEDVLNLLKISQP
jgi:osmotically-inducible protein OsmY